MFSDAKELARIKNELKDMKSLIERNTTDEEREAKQASKMCSQYRNKCLETQKVIDEISESTAAKLRTITADYEKIKELKENISSISNSATTSLSEITELEEQVETVQNLFDDKENLEEKIESLVEFHDSEKDTTSKIGALHTLSRSRKNEIDELYYEIFGYEEEEEVNNESEEENDDETDKKQFM